MDCVIVVFSINFFLREEFVRSFYVRLHCLSVFDSFFCWSLEHIQQPRNEVVHVVWLGLMGSTFIV